MKSVLSEVKCKCQNFSLFTAIGCLLCQNINVKFLPPIFEISSSKSLKYKAKWTCFRKHSENYIFIVHENNCPLDFAVLENVEINTKTWCSLKILNAIQSCS